MNKWKLLAATLVSAAILAPAFAAAADMAVIHRHARHAGHWYGLPYPISYLHNYGPGLAPGTFAFYDGPSNNFCYQGSAAYIGQDRRRHPCF